MGLGESANPRGLADEGAGHGVRARHESTRGTQAVEDQVDKDQDEVVKGGGGDAPT